MTTPKVTKYGNKCPPEEKKAKMMALTSMVNPLKADQVMIFSSEGEDYKLGLHFRPLDGRTIQSFGSALEKSVATPLKAPSTLVSLVHEHAVKPIVCGPRQDLTSALRYAFTASQMATTA